MTYPTPLHRLSRRPLWQLRERLKTSVSGRFTIVAVLEEVLNLSHKMSCQVNLGLFLSHRHGQVVVSSKSFSTESMQMGS